MLSVADGLDRDERAIIGVAEVLGGFGLILPGITRIQRRLTPIAAAGLASIMFGAVISTAAAMGIVALMAGSYDPDYWFAIILASSIYRAGCGIGHIRSIVKTGNFAINNTAILFQNFVVPAFLLAAWYAWA